MRGCAARPAELLAKQVIPSIIVVYFGLAALYMSASDHTGDRAALISVSALILLLNFQSELVIGSVPYLVWWDVFNLLSFLVLSISLAESLAEHAYFVRGEEERSLILNKTSRITILLGIYPTILAYVFIAGMRNDWGTPAALGTLVVGLSLSFGIGLYVFSRQLRVGHGLRQGLIAELKATEMKSASFGRVLAEAFQAFDLDDSGFLDIDEVRCLLEVMLHETLGPVLFAKAMLTTRKYTNVQGNLSLASLFDALVAITSENGLPVPEKDACLSSAAELVTGIVYNAAQQVTGSARDLTGAAASGLKVGATSMSRFRLPRGLHAPGSHASRVAASPESPGHASRVEMTQ